MASTVDSSQRPPSRKAVLSPVDPNVQPAKAEEGFEEAIALDPMPKPPTEGHLGPATSSISQGDTETTPAVTPVASAVTEEEEAGPPTPSKDPSFNPATPELPDKGRRPSIPVSQRDPRFWSPSLTASRPSSSRVSLSRQASISNASSQLSDPESPLARAKGLAESPQRLSDSSVATPIEQQYAAATPRSARSANRKRMSLNYVASPAAGAASSPAFCLSPTPSSGSATSASRTTFRSSSHRSATALDAFGIRTAPASQTSYIKSSGDTTPQIEQQQPSWPTSSSPREDGQTVMDSSKEMLAEIARRERKIGELRSELRQEETELKALQAKWQAAVTKEMGAVRSPDRSSLRAPRQVNGARTGGAAVNVPANIKPTSGEQSWESQADVAASVAEAMRGFSSKLPAGLGSQLNTLIDGLHVPAPSASSDRPNSPRALDMLKEESSEVGSDAGDKSPNAVSRTVVADSNRPSSSASGSTFAGPPPAFSTSNASSKRSSTLFGSLSAFRGQIEESLKAAQQPSTMTGAEGGSSAGRSAAPHKAVGLDGLPVSPLLGSSTSTGQDSQAQTAGWSQWSKTLKDAASDAAARAEKAFGEAITSGGLGAGEATAKGAATAADRPTGSMPISSGSSMSKMSPTLERRSFTEENEREKAALAELELGWLSNLVGGSGGSGAASSSEQVGSSDSQPRRLSDRTLLALSAGDGLAPEPQPARSSKSTSTGMYPPSTTSTRKNTGQADPSGSSGAAAAAAKRQSTLTVGGNLFGMLSQAWGGEKIGSEQTAAASGNSSSTSSAGTATLKPNGKAAASAHTKAGATGAPPSLSTRKSTASPPPPPPSSSALASNRIPLSERLKVKKNVPATTTSPPPNSAALTDSKGVGEQGEDVAVSNSPSAPASAATSSTDAEAPPAATVAGVLDEDNDGDSAAPAPAPVTSPPLAAE
ncbi:hypothetical protein BCV69DRAFT_297461 [Microstroma glucosiphilum]|uniref:DUF4048 domain-containing protein n=1 Tax=Pseudomicrostroma glucosiphilum TaxID=1684307 RepID=A0A316UCM0_9BASI|nr:hypothetical protein BCV69DRAFT_297461 [Pseudomicrostroma glucosiphilum]PWN22161.1 hypothetical protein BCV69DRAFT_297461 [Pseudomicrostroma glucosiphilum]